MFETEQEAEFDVFTDLLFNSLVAISFLFFLAFAMINPIAETGKIDPKAELLITVRWPDNNPDDVDTYVEDPIGNVVWYHEREAGLMHLDRDDRGMFKDIIVVNGQEVANPLNQESVSIRGLANGEYVVNIVRYIATTSEPLRAEVKVEKLNPVVKVIFYGKIDLNGTGDEKTAVRFTLTDGEVGEVNNRPKSLVSLTRQDKSPNSGEGGGGPLVVGLAEVADTAGPLPASQAGGTSQ